MSKTDFPVTEDIFYDPGFRALLEASLDLIRNDSSTSQARIDEHKARIYRRDFYTYLKNVGIQYEYHWIIMRLNNMRSPYDFDETVSVIYVPSESMINKLKITYRTQRNIRSL